MSFSLPQLRAAQLAIGMSREKMVYVFVTVQTLTDWLVYTQLS